MPFGRDWSTLEALKGSSKAQLQYSNKWDLQEEDLIEASVESCKLSPYYGWVLDTLVLPKEDLNTTRVNGLSHQDVGLDSPKSLPAKLASPGSTSPVPAEIQTEEANQNSKETDHSLESSLIQQSPKAMEVEAAIRMYKEEKRMKLKEEINQRMEMMEQVSKSFAEKAAEQFKRYEETMELKRRQEQHELQEQLEKSSKEAMEKQEKLKEEHRHKAKLLSLRLREAEQQRQQKLERVRQEEGRERMRRLCSLQQEALQLIQQIEVDYKQQESLRLDLSAYSDRGNQICGILSNIVRSSSESGFPSHEDVSMGERSLQEMRALVGSMQREAAIAEEKRKAEEAAAKVKQRQAEVQQQQDKAQTPVQTQDRGQARKEGLQEKPVKNTMQKYQHFQSVCDQCLQAFSQLSTCKDTQTKKVKADLQKAVTIPVSQISTGPASHLKEIFDKLNSFLLGKQLASWGQKVSVTQHPQGMEFACYKLAEKFVKQGEEEVASHHKAAFPIAAVASGIWEAHPRVGELFLAHLHKKCPYAVPFYPAYKEGTPFEEYQRLLGYRVEDSVAERQDNFLKRMSGMIRLYAAIIQIRWPFGTQQASSHPHGLNHGWTWMAQTLNMEPLVDVTATLLFDFLEVCGNALLKQYQNQFWKILLLLKDEYLPRIERITSDAQLGSLTRLKLLVEDIFRKREIPLPKGYLPPNFWRT